MAQTVVGLFENEQTAREAANRLESAGISRSNVDVGRSSAYTQQQNVQNDREGDSGIVRFFKNLFGDDSDDAQRYSRVSSSGNYTIVTVHAASADEAERAADLLDEYGAVNVDERDTEASRLHTGSQRTGAFDTDRRESDATVQRVQENLEVGKREVERGGVRLRSRIVERPVEETLRLREEHVTVERNPVNRPLGEADRNAFQEQSIELTERAEVPVVNKEARVVEEIKISKDVDERTETIRDTVRETKVDVENIGDRNDETRLYNQNRQADDELNRNDR